MRKLISLRWAACLASIGLCIGTFAPLAAESPDVLPSNEVLQKLVGELGDNVVATRDAAQKKLEALPAGAVDALRPMLEKTKDVEVKERLTKVVTTLELAQSLKPTLFSIDVKDQPMSKVFEELSKSAGVKLEVSGSVQGSDIKNQLVSLKMKDVPFWEGVKQLNEQLGLFCQENWYGNGEMRLHFFASENSNVVPGITTIQGPFKLSLQSLNFSRSVYFNNNRNGNGMNQNGFQQSESLNSGFVIQSEPRFPLLGIGQATVTTAEDETGQSLLFPIMNNRSFHSGGHYRSMSQSFNVQLKPNAGSRKLKLLEGTVPVTVLVKTTPKITVENLAKVKEATFKQGNTTVVISEVNTDNNRNTSIKMKISENSDKGAQPNDYTWINTLHQRLEVVDDKGVKMQHMGGNWSNSSNTQVEGTFNFGPGTPGKFVLYEWVSIVQQVPFKFQEIPLP